MQSDPSASVTLSGPCRISSKLLMYILGLNDRILDGSSLTLSSSEFYGSLLVQWPAATNGELHG